MKSTKTCAIAEDWFIYSRVSFCDGLFYNDSLLWPLLSPTKHSWLVVHHCHNSSILSLLSMLLGLFQCMCSFFFYFSWLWFFHPWCPTKRQIFLFCKKGVKRTRNTVMLETKMSMFRKMEAGEKRANVCSSLSLAPVTVSTIMVNTEKIKQSAKKSTKMHT